jgi:hypothetical protein
MQKSDTHNRQMSSDALQGSAVLDTLLLTEMYQRMHALALQRATRGLYPCAVPSHIDVECLKQRVSRAGSNSYLVHPADIDRIFTGVTLRVYQTVETLYCSRLGLSIAMVWQIMNAMAQHDGAAPLTYEAVWAICLYLEERRRASLDISVERGTDIWWVAKVTPDIRLHVRNTAAYRPTIVCVIDTSTQHVLSFRIASEETYEESIALALYDALISQRRPQRFGLTGLVWHFPKHIMTDIMLPRECSNACRRMGIQVEVTTGTPPVVQAMRDTWAQSLAGRELPQSHCAVLLDTYLSKFHGYGPLREREQRDSMYAGSNGYSRDPAWQFPLLRLFLPQRRGAITEDGAIVWNNMHYTHELLCYWPGHPVTLRLSAHSQMTVWVYLEEEILCQAAREVRRVDGQHQLLEAER